MLSARRPVTLSSSNTPAPHAHTNRRQHGLSIEQRGEWLRLVLHAGRQKGMAVGMLAVGLVFAAVGWFVPGDDFGSLMLKGVFGLFGWGL